MSYDMDPIAGNWYQHVEKGLDFEVVAVDESASVPVDSYTGCIRTRDYTPLEPSSNELKVYCPGVGNVQVIDMTTGEVSEELTSFTMP